MDEQKNNIRVLFTVKANSALDDIMKNFDLEENQEEIIKRAEGKKPSKIVVIDHLAKDFVIGLISEKNLTNSLEKDLGVNQQTAEQIAKEIILKIVPFLEKVPEEKFKDPVFVEEISKKIFGESAQTIKPEPRRIDTKEGSVSPDIEPMASVEEVKTPISSLLSKKIKKIVPPEKGMEPKIKQSKGPDAYREPIG